MHHDLKCWPVFFEKTWAGIKPFELRRNDRDYRVGDTVTLQEWDPEPQDKTYTGRWIKGLIDWLADELFTFGLMDGYCAFTFKEMERGETPQPEHGGQEAG